MSLNCGSVSIAPTCGRLLTFACVCRENRDDSGAVPQQAVGDAAGRGLRHAGAALHRHHLLLLHAQVDDAAQAHVVGSSLRQQYSYCLQLCSRRNM